jgi:hypothetical protein
MAVAELVRHLLQLRELVVVLIQCHQVPRRAGCPLQGTMTIQEELKSVELDRIK